jgi:DNA repair and recombination protein RAD52
VDFFDEDPRSHKIDIGLSVVVRVTLRDGTYHEDVGYGHTENCKGKAAAFEKAKKSGTTDAMKRALRHFGNVLGNCIYDKGYLAKVTKLKVPSPKFDEDALHRHSDFAVKKEPVTREPSKEDKPIFQAPQCKPAHIFGRVCAYVCMCVCVRYCVC